VQETVGKVDDRRHRERTYGTSKKLGRGSRGKKNGSRGKAKRKKKNPPPTKPFGGNRAKLGEQFLRGGGRGLVRPKSKRSLLSEIGSWGLPGARIGNKEKGKTPWRVFF